MAHSGLVYQDNRKAQREKEKFLYYLTIAPLQWYSIGIPPLTTKTGPLIHRVKVTR